LFLAIRNAEAFGARDKPINPARTIIVKTSWNNLYKLDGDIFARSQLDIRERNRQGFRETEKQTRQQHRTGFHFAESISATSAINPRRRSSRA
jgi:hypothetical protein